MRTEYYISVGNSSWQQQQQKREKEDAKIQQDQHIIDKF